MARLLRGGGVLLHGTHTGGEPAEMERFAEEVAKGDLYIELEDEGQTRGKESTGVYRSLIGMLDSLKMKAEVLQSIADKDLTVDVQKASDRDVFGEYLITMKNSLNEILLQVFSAVAQFKLDQSYKGMEN
ncbi:MAG: hypothetical protein U5P10_17070 [Spirochaetia bacterium]|nr:hypothetical protein [Spirochaetia bacterium]